MGIQIPIPSPSIQEKVLSGPFSDVARAILTAGVMRRQKNAMDKEEQEKDTKAVQGILDEVPDDPKEVKKDAKSALADSEKVDESEKAAQKEDVAVAQEADDPARQLDMNVAEDYDSGNESSIPSEIWLIAPGRAIRKKRTVVMPQLENKQTCETTAYTHKKREQTNQLSEVFITMKQP
jgi:hypothetical protein